MLFRSERAGNELLIAELLQKISGDKNAQNYFQIKEETTFYSGVISHSYYCIFYCAKAMLLTKNIKTDAPEIHKKTFNAFKEMFIDSGTLDATLLIIYQAMIVRAEGLLEMYKLEKKKRGVFTYNTIPQANRLPAEESIMHAKDFFKHCRAYLKE